MSSLTKSFFFSGVFVCFLRPPTTYFSPKHLTFGCFGCFIFLVNHGLHRILTSPPPASCLTHQVSANPSSFSRLRLESLQLSCFSSQNSSVCFDVTCLEMFFLEEESEESPSSALLVVVQTIAVYCISGLNWTWLKLWCDVTWIDLMWTDLTLPVTWKLRLESFT